MTDVRSIIVEGPDRVGKTTIVKHLSQWMYLPAFKAPSEKIIFKEGGRQSLVFDYTLTHFLAQTGHRFISDRSYPSECVYSKVFERDTDWDLLNRIDEAHSSIGTTILYLYSSTEPTEKDDLVPDGMYWTVKERYDWFRDWTDCRVVSYDTADMLKAFGEGYDDSPLHVHRIMREILK